MSALCLPASTMPFIRRSEHEDALSSTLDPNPFPFSKSPSTPNTQVSARIAKFKADLRNMPAVDVTRKHVTFGNTYLLSPDEVFLLRSEISGHFGCHPAAVTIVGSAQLGVSIAPEKRYLPFHRKSDIDLAIVSDSVFDQIWMLARDYQATDPNRWGDVGMFRKYLMNGWIRPDALPLVGFPRRTEWLEFLGNLKPRVKNGGFRLNAGLYRSHAFLEAYQLKSVEACRRALELER